MKSLLNTLTLCFLLVCVYGAYDPICDTPLNTPTFKQEECLGTWYQYSNSDRCDNCCIIRTLELIKPGVLNITDVFYKPNESHSTSHSFIAKRFDSHLTYYYGSDPTPMLYIDGPCHSHATLKKLHGDKVEVFVRDVKFVPKHFECGVTLYKNNPEVSCLRFL